MPTTDDTPADGMPASVRKMLAEKQRRIDAGFIEDGQTGPNEAALRESHNEAVLAPKKVFTLGGRTFVLAKPTNADLIGLRRHLIACYQSHMGTALESTLAAFKRLRQEAKAAGPAAELPFDEEDYRAALELAIATESKKTADPKTKGKAEPTSRQLEEYTTTLEGVREYVWFRLAGVDQDVAREWVTNSVTDANMLDVMKHMGDDTGMTAVDPK